MNAPDIFNNNTKIPKTTDANFEDYVHNLIENVIDESFYEDSIAELQLGIDDVYNTDVDNVEKIKTLLLLLATINKSAYVSSQMLFDAISKLENA